MIDRSAGLSHGSGAQGSRPEVCVGAIAIEDGKLLLVRRGHGPAAGWWSVPGGRVEPGETLAEETGLEGVCDQLVGWVERIGEGYHFVILDFRVTVLDQAEPVAGDDATEATWVKLQDVAAMALVEGLAEFLHEHGLLDVIV